jgi:hypothetical protein
MAPSVTANSVFERHLRWSLEGGLALSKAVLASNDLAAGAAGPVTPPDAPPEKVAKPRDAWVGSARDSSRELARRLDAARGGDDCLLVIEDDLKTAADRGEGTVTLGEELYHVAPCALVADPEAFRVFVDRSSAGYPLNGFVVAPAGELPAELTLEHVDRLAGNVRAIFVGAYDGTGFVVWTPS